MIAAMTLAEAGEIFAYWEHNPPAHLMLQAIARLVGWSPPGPLAATPAEDIAAAPPPGLAVVRGGDLGLPPPILDPAQLRARNRARALAAALDQCAASFETAAAAASSG